MIGLLPHVPIVLPPSSQRESEKERKIRLPDILPQVLSALHVLISHKHFFVRRTNCALSHQLLPSKRRVLEDG